MPSYRNGAATAVMTDHDMDRSTVGAFLGHLGAAFLTLAVAMWRAFWRRPLDSLVFIVVSAAVAAILINALFMQASQHPAPMLPGKARPVGDAEATALRPGETLARSRLQIVSDIQRELSRRGFFDGPIDGVYGAKTDAAIRDFEQAAGLKTNAQPDEALLRTIMRSQARAMPALPAAAPAPPPAMAAPSTPVTMAPAPPAKPTPAAAPATSAPPPFPLARPASAPRAAHTPAAAPRATTASHSVAAPPRPAAAIPAHTTVAAAPAAAPPATTAAAPAHPVPPAPVGHTAPSSRRIVAVQRALSDFGYGQLKANGVVGPETKVAIERFERERKLPVSGQISDRLVRELAAVTGRPLE